MFRKNFKKGMPGVALAKSGFSLVELLVVITIIAIMSVVAYTAVGGQTIKARDSRRQQDLSSIQSALELYFNKNYRYPETLETGNEGAPDYKIPKTYLSAIPKDPGGKAYIYKIAADKKTYEVAATLEVDGILTNFKTYVVGNGTNLVQTVLIPDGKFYNTSTGNLASCAAGKPLTNDQIIGQSTLDNTNCIPYDPR